MSRPYTYLIGWTSLNLWYYGSKTGKDAIPSLFWKNYFTSSIIVKQTILEYGEPDIIEVRKTFNTKKDAINWERNVLIKINAIYSDNWLNQCIGGMLNYVKAYTKTGKPIVTSPDDPRFLLNEIYHYNKNMGVFKDKSGNAIQLNVDEAKKLGLSGFTKGQNLGKNNPFYGKSHTKESKLKMRGKRSNFSPWNKGEKVKYGKIWEESMKTRDISGTRNGAFGRKWFHNKLTKEKIYSRNINLLEYIENHKDWSAGTGGRKETFINITNQLEEKYAS